MMVLPPEPPAVVQPYLPPSEQSVATSGVVRVAAALTDAQVKVDSSFQGAKIVLYGAVFNPSDTPADVVVVVRGPDAPVRLVRRPGPWASGSTAGRCYSRGHRAST